MRKTNLMALALICLTLIWAPCASQAFTIVTKDMLQEQTVVETDLIPTVDNFIVKLRKKIEDDYRNPRHILTIYGVGYKLSP